MIRDFRGSCVLVMVLSLTTVVSKPVYSQQCETVLTETGRNHMRQINESDQAAWYYKNVCEGSAIGVGGKYTEESSDLFSQAKTAIGFNYNSQQSYCSSEASTWKSYTYSSTDTSTVMASSTLAWLKCIELTRKGISITPNITPRVITFALHRIGKTNGIVHGVKMSQDISCSATIVGNKGVTSEQDLSSGSIGHAFRLADVDTLTIYCSRTPLKDSADAVYYAGGDITVVTSEGSLTLELTPDTLGKEVWASDVLATLTAQNSKLVSLNAELADAKKRLGEVTAGIPNTIVFDPPVYAPAGGGCPFGSFVTGVETGSGRVLCSPFKLGKK